MANQDNSREDSRNESYRRQQQQQNQRVNQSFTGQTGGQWGENIHDAPYNLGGGSINTQTNYDQGNYDYSEPGAYGFDQGNQYGESPIDSQRYQRPERRQHSSFPADNFSGRDNGNQGADQAYGTSFGNKRNAAYDDGNYRSGGYGDHASERRRESNYGQPNYGGSGPYSRSQQPGFDHGDTFQNRKGNYEDFQSGSETSNYRNAQATEQRGEHRGKGPKGYTRSDRRIEEDVNDRLTEDHHIDASDIEVRIQDGAVVLTGQVMNRFAKRHAAELAETVSGVKNVENRLRVQGSEHSNDLNKQTKADETSEATDAL